jgi:hypothetical protein
MSNCLHQENMKRCRRKAVYFGRWAGGGLCFEHAKPFVNELHYEDRVRFLQELEAEPEANRRGLTRRG